MSDLVIIGGIVLDPLTRIAQRADLSIIDGRIERIAERIDLGEGAVEVIDAEGGYVLPGLVDAHLHAWQYAWRGVNPRTRSFADYLGPFLRHRDRYRPEDLAEAVELAALRQLDAGITGVIDYLNGAHGTAEHVRAAQQAHIDSGRRSLLLVGDPIAPGTPTDAARVHQRIADLAALRDEIGTERSNIGAGLRSVGDTPDAFELSRVEISAARRFGLRMSLHQNGRGEIAALHAAGSLGPDLVLVHANAASDEEFASLAATRTVLVSTPRSEIGVGWSPRSIPRAIRAGVPLALGIDTPSTLPLDLWGELRALHQIVAIDDVEHALAARPLLDDAAAPAPPTIDFEGVLAIGASGGAAALQGAGTVLGSLVPGAPADLIVVRPRDVEAAASDPAAAIVQTVGPAEVDTVVIGGVVRKRAGRLVGADPDALRERERMLRHRVQDLG